ncbi:hypothetical protein DOTSEDRAFT_75300 [Dothistroma septosporum NZE10]|uniref:Diphthine--ammonia ligase n=1 Tax=Dothistroma septosporum (strain NZE10 / CBS 128990) TaxID=675120 RepID=M2YL54_DOTSN|nr:hypothetical protein DOTSEDRAFT_75300 [Dothistroma septosporum NZE10]
MGLNVVALISGGKDSFFSVLHCQANGHSVVALANLHPPHHEHGQADDLESYMYQTIGHNVIPLYERALGLPLYRQEIHGGAVNQAKDYGGDTMADDDETESLIPLLKKVIAAHPEVNAVSTGAILSDYQRTRVENVALRLGLAPLSFLWQWPNLPPHTQTTLLEDMAAVGQDSRIIKVASGGLDESFLWNNVADRRTIMRLSKAAHRFGALDDGAVLGEGGEYETLAISGPAPLWKGRIEVPENAVTTVPGEAGSASVSIARPSVMAIPVEVSSPPAVRIPPLLEHRFRGILDSLQQGSNLVTELPDSACRIESSEDGVACFCDLVGAGDTLTEQTHSIMAQTTRRLGQTNHQLSDIMYTIVTLRDMSDFPVINAAYGSYFVWPNPPARVTIACAEVLPPEAFLTMSFAFARGPREGLHVQSRSYWAPANIGPYSQAIKLTPAAGCGTANGPMFIAGQIPLMPAAMVLPPMSESKAHSFAQQAVLALQHLERISRAMKVQQWNYGIAFIIQDKYEAMSIIERARMVRRVWSAFHGQVTASEIEDETPEDFDVWNNAHGTGRASWRVNASSDGERSQLTTTTPPLVVINADSLPREADVEWVGCGESVGNGNQCTPSYVLKLFHKLLHSSRVVRDDN